MNGQEISEGGSAEHSQNNGTSSILHVPRKIRPEEVEEGSSNNEDNTMSAGAVLIDLPRPIRDDRNNNNEIVGGEDKNDHETAISITAAAPAAAAAETATSITFAPATPATPAAPATTTAEDDDEDGAATLALMSVTMFSPSAAERVKRNRRPPTKFVARPSKFGCVDDGAFLNNIGIDKKKKTTTTTTKKQMKVTTETTIVTTVGEDVDSSLTTGGVITEDDTHVRLLHKGDLVKLSPES
jgi:hypothetical protein